MVQEHMVLGIIQDNMLLDHKTTPKSQKTNKQTNKNKTKQNKNKKQKHTHKTNK